MGRIRLFKIKTIEVGENMIKKWEVNKTNAEEVEEFAKNIK